jgi:hypothetical protein
MLDERAGAAVDVVAEEAAYRQHHLDRTPRDGQIRQVPSVAAVHPGRHPIASPAPRSRARGCAVITTVPSTSSTRSITTGDS